MLKQCQAVGLIVSVLIGVSCGKHFTGEPIHFQIPTGFRGEIQIVEDKTRGVVLGREGGRLVVQVPASGRVVVRSFHQFERWHEESASFADGTSIAIPAKTAGEFPRDRLGFYGAGTARGGKYTQETVVYFVGTKQELERLE